MSFAPAERLGLDLGVRAETIVGVRPEHARPWARATACSARSTGEVEYVEALGRETFLGVRHDDGDAARAVRRGPLGGPARRPRPLRPRPRRACASSTPRAAARARHEPTDTPSPDTLAPVLSIELAVATPAFLDLTFVGLESPARARARSASPASSSARRAAAPSPRSPPRGSGLQTALVAPLGNDLGGEYVRRELEGEGVAIAGFRTKRTPRDGRDAGRRRSGRWSPSTPGIRARAADVAALTPVAIAANLDQLDLLPNGARSYLTCGDDDARAFSRQLAAQARSAHARCSSTRPTPSCSPAPTRPRRPPSCSADWVQTVVITLGAERVIAMTGGHRVEVPDFETGPVVDTTGDRDLLCAAYAWADLRGAERRRAPELGAALLAARDERADRHRRRASPRSGCSRRAPKRGLADRRATPDRRRRWASGPPPQRTPPRSRRSSSRRRSESWGEEAPAMEPPPIHGGELSRRGRRRHRGLRESSRTARSTSSSRTRARGAAAPAARWSSPPRTRCAPRATPRSRCGRRSATPAPAASTRRRAGARRTTPASASGTARRCASCATASAFEQRHPRSPASAWSCWG